VPASRVGSGTVSVLAHFGYFLLASSAILPLLSAFKRRDPGLEIFYDS
jgi:hypothetical protein